MKTLDQIMKSINRFGGVRYFEEGDIIVQKTEKGELYWDKRNYTNEHGEYIIHPVAKDGNYIFFICQHGQLHSIWSDDAIPSKSHVDPCCNWNRKHNVLGLIWDGIFRKYKQKPIRFAPKKIVKRYDGTE